MLEREAAPELAQLAFHRGAFGGLVPQNHENDAKNGVHFGARQIPGRRSDLFHPGPFEVFLGGFHANPGHRGDVFEGCVPRDVQVTVVHPDGTVQSFQDPHGRESDGPPRGRNSGPSGENAMNLKVTPREGKEQAWKK